MWPQTFATLPSLSVAVGGIASANAGDTQGATIGDYVLDDLDRDGIQDEDEAGVGGVTVSLTDHGGTEVTTTTTIGAYSFADLKPGTYTVVVDGATVPAPKLVLRGPAGSSRGAGDRIDTIDFGIGIAQLRRSPSPDRASVFSSLSLPSPWRAAWPWWSAAVLAQGLPSDTRGLRWQ